MPICDSCGKELPKGERRTSVGKTEWLKEIAGVKEAKVLKLCEACLSQYCFCCGRKFEDFTQGIIDIDLARYGFFPSEYLPFHKNTEARFFICPGCYKPLKERHFVKQIEYLKRESTAICHHCRGVNDSVQKLAFLGKGFVSQYCQSCLKKLGRHLHIDLHRDKNFTLDHVNEQDGFARWAKERKK